MSSHVDKEETNVVTYVEVFLFFIVFSFILYILYPKDVLYKQVLAEKSNYDLTATYLENMIRLEPNNKELIHALIKSSMRSFKTDLALKMINILEKDASESEKKEFIKYKFIILKTKHFSTNEKEIHNKIIKQMKILFASVIEDEMYIQDEIIFWYKSSREFSLKKSALHFLKILVKKEMAKSSTTWQQELAEYYLEIKKYSLSSTEYMKLYKKSSSSKEKKIYFIKSLQSLQFGSLLDKATKLAKKHEVKYYKDKKISLFMIKLYLNANKLDDAKRVSIKRLEHMD